MLTFNSVCSLCGSVKKELIPMVNSKAYTFIDRVYEKYILTGFHLTFKL